MAFSVAGKHVTVVGAAAAASPPRSCSPRGARVTLVRHRARTCRTRRAARSRRRGRARRTPDRAAVPGADLVVLSPGVPPGSAGGSGGAGARRAGDRRSGAGVALAARRVMAITGTKGKSTTTTLTARMLEAAGFDADGRRQHRQPLSAQVAASRPETLHVVEASSFQLEGTDTFHPWIAVLLNLSPDHLDRHASFELRRREGAHLREPGRGTTGRWSTPTIRRAGAGARRGRARAGFDFAVDRRRHRRSRRQDCRTAAATDDAPRAAQRDPSARPAPRRRRDGRGDGRLRLPAPRRRRCSARVEAFSGLEHALELVAEIEASGS